MAHSYRLSIASEIRSRLVPVPPWELFRLGAPSSYNRRVDRVIAVNWKYQSLFFLLFFHPFDLSHPLSPFILFFSSSSNRTFVFSFFFFLFLLISRQCSIPQTPASWYFKVQPTGRTCLSGTSSSRQSTRSTATTCCSSCERSTWRRRRDTCQNSRRRWTCSGRTARSYLSAIPTSIGRKPCTWIWSCINSTTRSPWLSAQGRAPRNCKWALILPRTFFQSYYSLFFFSFNYK